MELKADVFSAFARLGRVIQAARLRVPSELGLGIGETIMSPARSDQLRARAWSYMGRALHRDSLGESLVLSPMSPSSPPSGMLG